MVASYKLPSISEFYETEQKPVIDGETFQYSWLFAYLVHCGCGMQIKIKENLSLIQLSTYIHNVEGCRIGICYLVNVRLMSYVVNNDDMGLITK